MIILKEGVLFAVENFGSQGVPQKIQFTTKGNDGNFVSGTTNEEIVDMLIERFHFLNKQRFSSENQCVILLLKSIRQLMKKRLINKVDKVIKYQEKFSK